MACQHATRGTVLLAQEDGMSSTPCVQWADAYLGLCGSECLGSSVSLSSSLGSSTGSSRSLGLGLYGGGGGKTRHSAAW